MKFIKTQNTYKASNLTLDLNTMTAVSYGWWTFLKVVDGKLIFNDYAYSPSTQRHQSKVLKVLREEGIKIDMFIQSRKSLSDSAAFDDAIQRLESEIDELRALILKKGSKKRNNEIRAISILANQQAIGQIKLFLFKTPVMAEMHG